MNQSQRIIVVEDDPEIGSLLKDYLKRENFRVDLAEDGIQLDKLLAEFDEPDLIVLDLMLPGEDGLSICRRLRASSRVPIIILTARGEDIDRIIGLEMGADDYLPKPFNPRELLARIKAVLRRMEPPPLDEQRRLLKVADLIVDLDARKVSSADENDLNLTAAEFDLFECFVTRPNRVLSRDQLMDWTRGRRAQAFDRAIDVQMSRVRKKIERGGDPLIKTIRNSGYLLVAPVEPLKG